MKARIAFSFQVRLGQKLHDEIRQFSLIVTDDGLVVLDKIVANDLKSK